MLITFLNFKKIDLIFNKQLKNLEEYYNVKGKILENAQLLGQQSQISLGAYSGGMYFLQIIDPKQRKLKSFRIIKNQ